MRASDLTILELDPGSFRRTHSVLREGVKDGVAPGFVAGIWSARDPCRAFITAIGSRRTLPSVQPMRVDTVFDLASVTKIYATSMLAAVFVERGWLSYDTPIAQFFPSYGHRAIRVEHLLSHTAGFAAWAPFWERMRERFAPKAVEKASIARRQQAAREWVLAVEPEARVGERALYSDISFLLLGFALEEVAKMPLDEAVARFVWDPLGVERSRYVRVTRDAAAQRARAWSAKVAATEDSAWRGGMLQGQVHDDNCWSMGGYAGHAGAFGDARDLLHFARRLCTGYLSPRVLAKVWGRVPEPKDCERTLGWDTPSSGESMLGSRMPRGSVGHWGFTGTSLWIDPASRFAVTLLSNRVHPTRENTRIKAFRPRFHDALMLDLSGDSSQNS